MSTPIDIPANSVVPSPRSTWQALARGFSGRCPACGKGSIFGAYLKVRHACEACGTELHHHRADDAPPYFTMLIVGHIVVGSVLSVERMYAPSLWVHMALWVPLTLGLSLALLPIVKGGLIGLQWALRMHGFGGAADPAAPELLAAAAKREGAR